MPSLSLPLLPNAYTISYPPTAPDKAPEPIQYFPLPDILSRAWTTDAHTTAYSVPSLSFRLSKEAITLENGIVMVVFIADIDCAQSHAASGGHGDIPAPDDWWLEELEKLEYLRAAFPGAFIYRTRGGYRLIYRLSEPRILRSPSGVDIWKGDYLAWIAALRVRFAIYADPSCHDWQRLFRVPHATRHHAGRPEARETVGNPYQIGVWTCEPTMEERELAKTLAKRPNSKAPREHTQSTINAGDGVFFYAFKSKGWIGKEEERGKWRVRCPWDDQHSKGKAFDGSTVLYGPSSGHTLGYLHCSHTHCQARDSRDVLRCFSRDELAQAEHEAGLPTFNPNRQCHQSHISTNRKGRWTFSETSGRWPSRIIVEVL
jgi:hypothetical protein